MLHRYYFPANPMGVVLREHRVTSHGGTYLEGRPLLGELTVMDGSGDFALKPNLRHVSHLEEAASHTWIDFT